MDKDISGIVKKQREYFAAGATLDVQGRIAALKRLQRAIRAREEKLCAALREDLGKSASESYMCEIGLTLSELSYQISHLKRWAKPKRHRTDLTNFHGKSFSVWEPYGCVLVMAPWNYPFLLCIEPMVGAIAAGNCCVLKPSAYSPATSAAIRELIREVFSEEYVAVVEGGRAENGALLEERFDYIFFTGGVNVGRLVMEKAAAHLTPVTLELGGKSPCIVDRTCNLKLAAARIAFGKYLNCGQTCVAPDYLLIDRSVKEEFLRLFTQTVTRMYGSDPLKNPDYGKIINQKHFERLRGLLDEKKLVFGGEMNPETLQIAPAVMDGVTAEDAVMQEEIFGPILPILEFDDIRQAFEFVRMREKPLAAYLFTGNKETEREFLSRVSFGGGCVNDTVLHLATSRMGFGGVGNSGMGSYHGRKSFETFSHEKSILKKYGWIDLPLRYQPYSKEKNKMVHFFLK
ncbi:MAG: aldehyde dehydrogenase [Lachnospiraceae bacterium]|nr:aldehyde dehydrogenase [Lachnospiraceae bacterium]